MITDNGLRLATAEVTPNGGAAPGGLGAASVTLALDPSGVGAQIRRAFADIGSGRKIGLNINITTGFTCATFGATLELQLVSIPILASALTNAATSGKLLSLAAVLTAATDTVSTGASGSLVGHGLPTGTPVFLTSLATTTGVANNTIYYVIANGLDTFQLATSLANALAGTAIDLLTGDGTAVVNFIPTVHASTGALPLYNAGVPAAQGPWRAGARMFIPLRSLSTLTPKSVLTGSGFSQPLGGGPTAGLIAANAQHYYYLRYVPSATMTAGAVTVDLVLDADNALQYTPSAYEVIG
jgi:hypothetical protein